MKLKAELEARTAAEKAASGESDGATGGGDGASGGATAMEEERSPFVSGDRKNVPQYAMGEDGRPRQHILTDTGMLLPAGYGTINYTRVIILIAVLICMLHLLMTL